MIALTNFNSKLENKNAFLYTLYVLVIVTVAISLQKYFSGTKHFWDGDYTHYNNYLIFKNSFRHLIDNVNLYAEYPREYADFYKYSPSFALLFSAFYFLPDWLGLTFWNLTNTLVLFFSIKCLPQFKNSTKLFVIYFIILELITSLQNSQSNALITGLLILSFVSMEKQNYLLAGLFIMLSVYIKIFGLVACVLALLYPGRIKLALSCLFWGVPFAFLPLLVISPAELFDQYNNWLMLLKSDNDLFYGISVFGIINSWFGIEPSKPIVLIAGIVLFLIPLFRINKYKDYFFRILMLSSVLIWMVIFNHKAESPTFIIALSGCVLWFVSSETNRLNISLIVLAFVFISLSPTDLFPKFLRTDFVVPYSLKALPAVLIWLKIIYEMFNNSTFEIIKPGKG
jgi:hypothetical protein